jgi:hypothetical protein
MAADELSPGAGSESRYRQPPSPKERAFAACSRLQLQASIPWRLGIRCGSWLGREGFGSLVVSASASLVCGCVFGVDVFLSCVLRWLNLNAGFVTKKLSGCYLCTMRNASENDPVLSM